MRVIFVRRSLQSTHTHTFRDRRTTSEGIAEFMEFERAVNKDKRRICARRFSRSKHERTIYAIAGRHQAAATAAHDTHEVSGSPIIISLLVAL